MGERTGTEKRWLDKKGKWGKEGNSWLKGEEQG
jgi:hypothetical protein